MKSYIEILEEKRHRLYTVLAFINTKAPSSSFCAAYTSTYSLCNKFFHNVAVQYKKEIETYLKENKLNRYIKVSLIPSQILVETELKLAKNVTERQFNNLYALCKLLGMS